MNLFSRTAASLLVFSISLTAFGGCEDPLSATDRERVELDTQSLIQTIQTHYGPILVKQQSAGLDVNILFQRFQTEARAAATVRDFYMAAARMLASLKDAHVSVQLPSNYIQSLPLRFLYTENKTLVLSVGDTLKVEGAKLEAGDEIVLIDGQTPAELQKKFAEIGSIGNNQTDPILINFMFTLQREGRGFPVEYAKTRRTELKIRKAGVGELQTALVDWDISGTPLVSRKFREQPLYEIQKDKPSAESIADMTLADRVERLMNLANGLAKAEVSSSITEVAGTFTGTNSSYAIGSPTPFFTLPADFKPLAGNKLQSALTGPLEAMSGLTAGTFRRNGKTVGFLRIPSYVPSNIVVSLFGLRSLIAKLQKQSDYLIIDQSNNPGGYVLFSDWLIWSLTGKWDDSKHMHFAVRPTQDFLRQYVEVMDAIDSEPSLSEEFKARYRPKFQAEFEKVKRAFEKQQTLSEPVSLALISEFFEELVSTSVTELLNSKFSRTTALLARVLGGIDLTKRQVYTKPVFMLINELDFSGGDATPANLQDYGRVTLIGQRTAGAGGAVGAFTHSSFNDFAFHLTNSLMIRSNPSRPYVENYGVLPEYLLPLTAQDVRDGFSGYFERLMKLVDAHLP